MELKGMYVGSIETMQNTPCKIAVYSDGKNIKVFQKAFYRNSLNRQNWVRNVILEKMNNLKLLESKIISLGFKGGN